MNPLNVLTGAMVMRRSIDLEREDGAIWLDATHRYRVFVNAASEPTSVACDGATQALGRVFDETQEATAAGVTIVPASMSLRTIIKLRQTSGHPVLLVEDGSFCGICDEAEIVRALAGSAHERDGAP